MFIHLSLGVQVLEDPAVLGTRVDTTKKVTPIARLYSSSLPTSSLYDRVSRRCLRWPELGGFLPPRALTAESRPPSIPRHVLQGAVLQCEGCWTLGGGSCFRCWFSLLEAGSGEKREMAMAGSSHPQLQSCFLHRLPSSFQWKPNLPGSASFCCSCSPSGLSTHWLALPAWRRSCSKNGSLLLTENAKANICVL